MKTGLLPLLALAALVAALLLACWPWRNLAGIERQVRRQFPGVRQMESGELARRLAAGEAIVLLDVRRPEEYAVSHLQGARRLDPDELQPSLPGVSPEATVVAYCSVGWRSSKMAERLTAAGFTHVYNLEGSIFKWAREGRELVQGEKATRVHQVHPYSPAWAFLVAPELRAYTPEAAEKP